MRSIFSVFPKAPFPDESFVTSNETHYKVRCALGNDSPMLLPLSASSTGVKYGLQAGTLPRRACPPGEAAVT